MPRGFGRLRLLLSRRAFGKFSPHALRQARRLVRKILVRFHVVEQLRNALHLLRFPAESVRFVLPSLRNRRLYGRSQIADGTGKQIPEIRLPIPNAIFRSVVRRESVAHRLVRRKTVAHGFVRRETVAHRLVRRETVAHRLVRRESVAHRLVRRETVAHRLIRRKSVAHGFIRRETVARGFVRRKTVAHRLVRRKTVAHRLVRRKTVARGFVRRESVARGFAEFGRNVVPIKITR
ncbi:MAG: histone H1-like repetitive region-containing protein [Candidatus Gallimonas sp.]